MKAVALFVIFAGYTAVCYGIDHITGNCTPFKTIVWPVGATAGDISVSCSGSQAKPAANPNASPKGSGNIGKAGSQVAKQVVKGSNGGLVIGPTGVPQPNYLPG